MLLNWGKTGELQADASERITYPLAFEEYVFVNFVQRNGVTANFTPTAHSYTLTEATLVNNTSIPASSSLCYVFLGI